MSGLPEITIEGTLTADPELRFTPNAIAVANFTVAANDRRFDKDTKEWVDKGATFLRCSAWRQLAENVTESLTKGARVLLTGQLRQREWQTEDGQKRYSLDVDVTAIGPSLRFATAIPRKASREFAPAGSTTTPDDPWGTAPPANANGHADEPPF